MPGLDGIAATRLIAGPGAPRTSRVVMLTTYDLDEYIYDALEAGASGFLLKDVAPEELIRGVCECCCELRDAPILPPIAAPLNPCETH